MRLLVTGGRNYVDADAVRWVLGFLLALHPDLVLVVGDCPTGLDAGAWWWATERGVPVDRFRAAWRAWGDRAGPIRNQAMVDSGPHLCVSFPGRYGTADCTQRAVNAGVKVVAVTDGTRGCRFGTRPGDVVGFGHRGGKR